MKVLVTGATGFIGRPLCAALLEAGYEVYAQARVGSDLHDLWGRPGLHLVYGHLGDVSWCDQLPDDLGIVFHLAVNWDRLDVAEDARFYDALRRFKLQRLIFFSSVCAAGLDLAIQPLREDVAPRFLPGDFYGRYKWEAEELTRCRFSASAATILRPTIVYGPGDQSNVYPLFEMIRRGRLPLWGHGQVKCRLCALENLLRITVAAARSERAGVETYFVADREELALRDSCAAIAEALGMRFVYRNYGRRFGRLLGYLRFVLDRLRVVESTATHFAFDKWTRSYDVDLTRMVAAFSEVDLVPMPEAMAATAGWYRLEGWL